MSGIIFSSEVENLTPDQLRGFFAGWPKPPTPEALLALLVASHHRWVAIDQEKSICVGYITALSDGVLFGYISSLEVLADFQHRGIGSELARRMTHTLRDLYAIDLVCDEPLIEFYGRIGFEKCSGMVIRRRDLL